MQAAQWSLAAEPRGEYTVVVEGASIVTASDSQSEADVTAEAAELVVMLEAAGIATTTAIKQAATITGVKRSVLYSYMLLQRKNNK